MPVSPYSINRALRQGGVRGGNGPGREAPLRGQVQEGESLLPFFVKGCRGRNGPAAVIRDREKGLRGRSPILGNVLIA